MASKVSLEHLKHDELIKSVKNSLKRLGISYLDLCYIHNYNPQIPLKETMAAMTSLMEAGLIKNIGVSNFSVPRLEKAQSYSRYKIVANQVHFNLQYREPEMKGVLDYCQKNDLMLIAWRPLQQGLLVDTTHLLEDIARKYQKTPTQIALNWLVSQDNIVTISKTNSPQHLKENLGALGWKMAKGDLEKLRQEFPDQKDISDTIPLR